VDKLHKIYSSTFEPLIWARSVGLEVINELDSIKAAFMMSAGASVRQTMNGGSASPGWNFAADAVGSIAGASSILKTLGQRISGIVKGT